MREIKFRAWDKEDKVMVEFFPGDNLSDEYFCEPFIIMQYTGLKDKNGKEIYEGDIVKHIDAWGRKKVDHIIGAVIFGEGKFSIHCQGADDNRTYRGWLIKGEYGHEEPLTSNTCQEIIGNIYENGDLLK
jgi:uncharacterized phage protein (TIGR01671 family)